MKPEQFQKAYGMGLDAFNKRVTELAIEIPARFRRTDGTSQIPRGELLAQIAAAVALERTVVGFLVHSCGEAPETVAELVEHGHRVGIFLTADENVSRAAAEDAGPPPVGAGS